MRGYRHCKRKTMSVREIVIVGSAFYGRCLIRGFKNCLKLHNKEEFGDLGLESCIKDCLEIRSIKLFTKLGICFEDCHDADVENRRLKNAENRRAKKP